MQAAFDPYKTLGVTPGADEKEIKKAHRRLVLQHHPDLQQGKDGVEVKFLAIQEAYEILIGKRRGKEVDSTPAGWDFHDWYWKFSMNRRKGGAKGAAAAGPPPPEATRHQWRQQISGLKAKAAAKAASSRGHSTTQHAATSAETERPRNPTEAASSSVWRSTTKNARKTQHASAGAPSNAFSDAAAQQRLHADAAAAAPAAATAPQPRVAPVESPSYTVAESFASVAAEQASPAPQDSPASHFAASTSDRAAGEHASTPRYPESETQQQQHVTLGLKVLLSKAVDAVHDLRNRHEGTVHAHAQRLQSHIAIWSDKLSHRLQFHALQHRISPDEELKYPSPLRWKDIRGSWDSDNHGVPSESDLHALFEGAMHSMQGSMRSRAHEQMDIGNSEFGEYQAASESYSYSSGDTHGRKFADKQHVQSRLSTQLTGLKRRAALKREYDD